MIYDTTVVVNGFDHVLLLSRHILPKLDIKASEGGRASGQPR